MFKTFVGNFSVLILIKCSCHLIVFVSWPFRVCIFSFALIFSFLFFLFWLFLPYFLKNIVSAVVSLLIFTLVHGSRILNNVLYVAENSDIVSCDVYWWNKESRCVVYLWQIINNTRLWRCTLFRVHWNSKGVLHATAQAVTSAGYFVDGDGSKEEWTCITLARKE
jgi:hypothetical protein